MDLEGVEVFVRVVETGSFTEAGRQLNLPKSTVSRRITKLEDALGVRLIQRTTRKLALTDAGTAYFGQVAPALASVRAADAWVGEMQSSPRGVVRITAPFDFGTNFLSEIVCEFVQRFPEIRVDVSLSDQMADLIADGFDLAFRGGKLEDSSLVARPMGRGKSWLVASPAQVEAHGLPESPQQLEALECVLFRAVDGQARWALEGPDGETETISVRGPISADEYGFVKSVLLGGRGVGCIPWLLCEQELSDGRLVRLLPGWGIPGGQMHLVYPSAQHLPQRVAVFRDFVLEWIQRPPWSTAKD